MFNFTKKLSLGFFAVAGLAAASIGTANAGVFVYGAPMVVTPAPVYVPTCRFVAVPFVNPWTGWTYFVNRQVCN